MADFNVSIILRLVERLTGPAQKSVAALGRVRTASLAGARAGKRFADAFEEAENRLSRLGTASLTFDRMIASGRALTGALIAPTQAAGAFQTRLREFGRVADVSGGGLEDVRKSIKGVSKDAAQMSGDVLSAVEVMVGRGLDVQRALDATPAIARTSTALKVSILDASETGFAAISNLNVAADNLKAGFEAMGIAAFEGGFEVNSMARFFPALTAQARALNLQGVPAIAELSSLLQFARLGAGTDEEAARNFQNFMAKITSKESVKRFEEFGINLESEMQLATDRGISPLMHMLELIQEVTEGDQFRIGELFGDLQVNNFLRAVLPKLDETKALTQKALSGEGFIDDNFADAMKDYASGTRAAGAAMDELQRSIGRAILPFAGPLIKAFTGATNALSSLVDAGGPAGTIIAGLVGALGVLMLAAGSLGSAAVSIIGTGIILNAGLKGIGISAGLSAAGLKALTRSLFGLAFRALPIAITGIRAMGVAMMTNPIGLVITAIAIGAALIFKYWSPLGAFFKGLFGGLSESLAPVGAAFGAAFSPALQLLKPVGTAIAAIAGWFGKLLAPVQASEESLAGMTAAGRAVGRVIGAAFRIIFLPITATAAAIRIVSGLFKALFSESPLGLLSRAWKPVLGFYQGLFKGILSVANGIFTRLMAIINGPAQFLKSIVGLAGKLLGPAAGAISLSLTAPAAAETPFFPDPKPPAPPAIGVAERPRLAPLPAPDQSVARNNGAGTSATTPAPVTLNQNNTFNITAPPGMDERALAKRLARMTKEEARRALHDGAA